MRALELTGFDGPASLRMAERPDPAPGPGEVRVRLHASGINHLDVFVTRGLPKRPLPAVLGADGAGTIDAVGEGVAPSRIGEDVVLYPMETCGTCEECRAGREVHCAQMKILGEHTDGTFQQALVARSIWCLPKPAHLTWPQAAALPLAWITAQRLLFTRAGLGPGDALLIVGIGGGVAQAAMLLAKAAGLRVIVTSRDEEKRERARRLGADLALGSDGYAAKVREATGGKGVRAAFDTNGQPTVTESLNSLAREGMLLTVGATAGPNVTLPMPRLWYRHLSVMTSSMGNLSDLVAVLRAVDTHKLRPPVDRVFPLADAVAAFARLESGSQFGKIILEP